MSIIVDKLAAFITGYKTGFKYLSRSILSFRQPEELKNIMLENNFKDVNYVKLFPGIVALHIARLMKPNTSG